MKTKETSKEALNEICNECNRIGDCDKKYGACPNLMKVWKDLEEKEKQDKILKTLKLYIEISSDGIISCHNLILTPYYKYYEEQYNLLKEWLDGSINQR